MVVMVAARYRGGPLYYPVAGAFFGNVLAVMAPAPANQRTDAGESQAEKRATGG
jgi:hypothetical protein